MQLTDATITVFNRRFDPEQDNDVYVGTIISNVHWFGTLAATVDNDGLKSASIVTVRIPDDADTSGKAYCDSIAYAKANPASFWTMSAGDIVVLGAADLTGQTPAKLKKTYADVITVLKSTDNRSAPRGKHIKVVGT